MTTTELEQATKAWQADCQALGAAQTALRAAERRVKQCEAEHAEASRKERAAWDKLLALRAGAGARQRRPRTPKPPPATPEPLNGCPQAGLHPERDADLQALSIPGGL